MHLYLIKRGPKPSSYKAPYHQVIICTRLDIAEWEAGSTAELAWAWYKHESDPSSGWGLYVWNGLEIVYNHAGHIGWDHRFPDGKYRFPDGTRPHLTVHDRGEEPWTLLNGAVWFSTAKMPAWMQEKGVVYPSDRFTQERIVDHACNHLGRYFSKPKYEERPAWWPEGSVETNG